MTQMRYVQGLLILSLILGLLTATRRLLLVPPSPTQAATFRDDGTGMAIAAGRAVTASLPATAITQTDLGITADLTTGVDLPEQTGGMFVQVVTEDADTLNPLLTTNSTSRAVLQKLYPVLVEQDPISGLPTMGRGLATQWQWAADGRTITFTLRSGVLWSDGVPVTAQDVKFTYDAPLIRRSRNAYRDNFANVNNVQVAASAPYTLVLQLANADCALFQALNQPILPSHRYQSFTASQLTDPNLRPTSSAGPFLLIDWIPGRRITLVRNAAYWKGAPRLERWEYHVIPDPLAQLQALIDGSADWLQLDPTQITQARANPALTFYEALADSLTFVALNLANGENPQPGRTAEGALNPQDPHPILSDRRVRQALAKAVNYDQLLDEVYGNRGQRLGAYILPTVSWAYAADLPPIAYDPAEAERLLQEAGWIDSDGDGLRDRSGVPLSLSLLTNADNPQRAQLGALLVNQWRQVGIDVRFEALRFDTVADRLLAQRYDMVLIGWDNLGADPANSDFWHSRYDAPGNGANFVSYQNKQVDTWLEAARTAPTCDPAQRGSLYRAVQQQIYQDLPYILLSGQRKTWAYPSSWQEIRPEPWRFDYNAHRWWRVASGG
ncbi:MAG: ABC transporter substrate-binding protein [Caldilineaceae bacterium]